MKHVDMSLLIVQHSTQASWRPAAWNFAEEVSASLPVTARLSSRRPGAEGDVSRQSRTTLFSLRTCALQQLLGHRHPLLSLQPTCMRVASNQVCSKTEHKPSRTLLAEHRASVRPPARHVQGSTHAHEPSWRGMQRGMGGREGSARTGTKPSANALRLPQA